jgi:hypothetical protein
MRRAWCNDLLILFLAMRRYFTRDLSLRQLRRAFRVPLSPIVITKQCCYLGLFYLILVIYWYCISNLHFPHWYWLAFIGKMPYQPLHFIKLYFIILLSCLLATTAQLFTTVTLYISLIFLLEPRLLWATTMPFNMATGLVYLMLVVALQVWKWWGFSLFWWYCMIVSDNILAFFTPRHTPDFSPLM